MPRLFFFFRIARPSQYLAIAGSDICDVKVTQKAWVLPWQTCKVFDISSATYIFDLKIISSDKVPFTLRTILMIAPNIEDQQCLLKYARLVLSHKIPTDHVGKAAALRAIRDATNGLTISMSTDEIFDGIEFLKNVLREMVQVELNKSGLTIYDAVINPLVNVALHETKTRGEVICEMDDAELPVTKRKAEVFQEMADATANVFQEMAAAKAQVMQVELQTMRQRADAELQAMQQRADAELLAIEERSDAELQVRRKRADAELQARRQRADAELLAIQERSDAELQVRRKRADAEHQVIRERAQARAQAMRKMGDDELCLLKRKLAEAEPYLLADAKLYLLKRKLEGMSSV